MKKLLLLLTGVAALYTAPTHAQTTAGESARLARWPLQVSVQFHSLSLPFRDLKTTFSNVGIGLGTELPYNRRGNLVQFFGAGYYRNRYAGDGLFVQTQVGYRPHVGPLYAEVKAGLGWHYSVHPNTTLRLEEGQWQVAGRTGKGMLMVPAGVSIGYARPGAVVAPFVGYQLFLLSGYNPSIPLVPNQMLQVGTRIYFKN